jgi:transposase
MTSDDPLLTDLERSIGKRATPHAANPCSRLRAMPGVGQICAPVLRSAIQDIDRFPRVQDCVASCRLVTCAQASAGQRVGPAGTTIGHASRTGAFSDAAALCLRHHPAGPTRLARREPKPGKGTALTILAHRRARAVYDRRTRHTACDLAQCLQGSRRRAGAPDASRAPTGAASSART